MSESSFPRWQPIAAAPTSLAALANTGISLTRAASGLIAAALLPPPLGHGSAVSNASLSPITLPMVPNEEVRRSASFLRSLYRSNGCRGATALYLNLCTGMWQAVLPQQLSSPEAFRANLRELAATHLSPHAGWRIAGSVQSFAMTDQVGQGASYYDEVPGFDGVHVVVDPRYVFFPRVILRLQDELCEVEPAVALLEPASGFEAEADDVWCKGGDV